MPQENETEVHEAIDPERLRRAAARGAKLLRTYDVLQDEYRYPMLQRMLRSDLPAKVRAKAALDYAKKVLREGGFDDAAKRIGKFVIEPRVGPPIHVWSREREQELINDLEDIFRRRRNLSLKRASELLADRDYWRQQGLSATALDSHAKKLLRSQQLTVDGWKMALFEDAPGAEPDLNSKN